MIETRQIKSVGKYTINFTDGSAIDLAWCPNAAAGQLWEIVVDDNTNYVISVRRLK